MLNDTNYTLSQSEIHLLSKGLTFVPTKRPNIEQIGKDLEILRRKLNLRAFWNRKPEQERTHSRSLLSNILGSNWDPPIETIKKDNEHWKEFSETYLNSATTCKQKHNLPKNWRETWKGLTTNQEFYLLKADKGGRMVIWSRENYEKEAYRQLEDKNTYSEMTAEKARLEMAKLHFTRTNVAETLRIKGNISQSEFKRLTSKDWEMPSIYFLPKIHKKKVEITGTFAGRPIMAAIKGPLKVLDEYLAALTRPLLKRIPGSLQDTRDLLKAMEEIKNLPTNAVLFSADVEALYPSIPWEEGIKAATDFYDENLAFLKEEARKTNLLPPPDSDVFKRILSLILSRNYFHYQNKRWFHQIKGTAMGCSISVYLANTFMYKRTRYLIENPPRDLIYLGRYIDDLIGVWQSDASAIPGIFERATDENIRLTFVLAPEELEALDLKIRIANNEIATRLFRKPTDGHQFLDWTSYHPFNLKESIPYSQTLRVKRNCSADEDYEKETQVLLGRFRSRGYPDKILDTAKKKADEKDRKDLLTSSRAPESDNLTFVTTYGIETAKVAQTGLRKLIEDLRQSELNEYLQFPASILPRVAFRVEKRLGDTIGKAFKKSVDGITITNEGVYGEMLKAGTEDLTLE